MAIEDIRKEVIESAESEAQSLMKEAQKKAKAILSDAKEKANQRKEGILLEAKKEAEKLLKKEEEAAVFEGQTLLLRTRKEILDEIIGEARNALLSLPAEKRKKHIEALLKKAKKEIDVDSALLSKKDLPFASGVKGSEANIAGGLIAQTKDGKLRVDLSYDTLFAEIIDEDLSGIYKELFSE